MATKQRSRLSKVKLDWISACDNPAQEGARVVLMKRDELAKRMPAVSKDEKEADYVSRFMADEAMKSEYDDVKQRAAVAHSTYSEAKKKKLGKYFYSDWGNPLATDVVEGHQHLLNNDPVKSAGDTTHEKAEGEDNPHSHGWIRNQDGSIEILMSEGHTHNVVVVTMPGMSGEMGASSGADTGADVIGEGEPMAKDESGKDTGSPELIQLRKDLDETRAKLEKSEATAAVSAVEATFTDDQRSIYAKLDEAGRVEFRKLDTDGRKGRVDQARGENPVVFTSEAGEVFRKMDDLRMVAIAKRADEQTRLAKADREALVLERLEKRAGAELSHLPGETPVKVALLKAIDGISDADLRAGAAKLLKAGDENLAKAFRTAGTALGLSADENGPEAKLEKMAKSYAEVNKVTKEQGWAAVLKTPEGQELAVAMKGGV